MAKLESSTQYRKEERSVWFPRFPQRKRPALSMGEAINWILRSLTATLYLYHRKPFIESNNIGSS